MNNALEILQANPYFNLFTTAIALASLFCAITPTPKKGSKIAMLYKGIEILALNIGKAKNPSVTPSAPIR